MSEERVVLFNLGSKEYAVSINQVKEIIHYKDATQMPNTPNHIKGVINLRGKIIPMVDLALRLGLAIAKSYDKQALIIETIDREVGIVVDEVTEVIRLQTGAIEPPPLAAANRYIRGIAKEGTRLLLLLDVDKLVGDTEMHYIE